MQSIRRRFTLILIICSLLGISLVAIFANITMKSKFDEYLVGVQEKRDTRIVEFLEGNYKNNNKWTSNSGVELIHEAVMGNYCLILYDKNDNVVWGMNPKDIKESEHLKNMNTNDKGIYTSSKKDIIVDNNIVGHVEIGQYSPILLSQDDVDFKLALNRSIIIGAFISFVIIVIISVYISKQFSTPIEEVDRLTTEISMGNFNLITKNKTKIKEIFNLQKSINILSKKLSSQEMIRRRLVNDISHEIRTPLNILQNNLEALIDGILPITTERLNSLNDEVIRFGKLLNNLDVLKEFEVDDLTLILEKISLKEIVETVVSDFKISADEKNIKLNIEVDKKNNFFIIGDKLKLRQVIINLISNAVKFTESSGEVFIKLYLKDGKTYIAVKDTGIGIKEEDIDFIFERLYRGDKSRNLTFGSGLGLTISKKILDLHKAKIEVKSEVNKGTTFTICLD